MISGRWVKVLSILERCPPVGEQEARQALESQFYRREGRRAMLKGEPFGQVPGRLYSPGTHQWLSWWRGYSEERARHSDAWTSDQASDPTPTIGL